MMATWFSDAPRVVQLAIEVLAWEVLIILPLVIAATFVSNWDR
jgi:hypothetical protein